jgi:hypothetical protein
VCAGPVTEERSEFVCKKFEVKCIEFEVVVAATVESSILILFFFNSHSGRWSPNGSTRHVGH